MKIAILALVAGACVATVTQAQQDSAKPRIHTASGEVATTPKTLVVLDDETDRKIVGAEVRDLLTGAVSYTDTNGVAVLDGMRLTAGKYNLLVRNMGYQSASLTIDKGDAPVIMLSRAVLAPVITKAEALSPTMQEFEMRRRTIPEGRFISEAEVREAEKGNLNFDVLLLSRNIRTWSRGCKEPPKIFIDGVLQSNFLMSVGIRDVGAVEFYSGVNAPLKFGGHTNCNVLVIWKREK